MITRTRAAVVSSGHRRDHGLAQVNPDQRDEAWFTREVAPKFDSFTLAEIAAATGLSLALPASARARAPHPRHWEALLALVGASG